MLMGAETGGGILGGQSKIDFLTELLEKS